MVTAGLAESNGSLPPAGFMTHVTCRRSTNNRDQLRNPTLGNRVWSTFTFFISTEDLIENWLKDIASWSTFNAAVLDPQVDFERSVAGRLSRESVVVDLDVASTSSGAVRLHLGHHVQTAADRKLLRRVLRHAPSYRDNTRCFRPSSASTSTPVIPSTRRTTLGDRAFPVTAARAWNALPSSVHSAPSLLQFRRDLKTALFESSYSSP